MMDSLRATYRDEDDDNDSSTTTKNEDTAAADPIAAAAATTTTTSTTTPDTETEPLTDAKDEPFPSDDLLDSPKFTKICEDDEEEDDNEEDENPPPKKQKKLSSLPAEEAVGPTPSQPKTKRMTTTTTKKSKKKGNNVWAYTTSRKGKKKTTKKNNHNHTSNNALTEDKAVLVPAISRFPDKTDDTPDMEICLSKVYKAEKVELSDDRLSAGSTKGYRMVRATRGVVEGAWYFEIKVVNLGETGHTRLGWSTEKGDLQAPVGYDANSFGYRDIDGSKIHKALREKYGEEGYVEGDVIGFYISLPEGSLYAPKPPQLVWHKGQRYACAAPDGKEDPPKVVPGSEICFFKNGICQGVAFQDLYGGRYYPAASMYTLPNQPNCVVKFNFGPDFEFFPEDFGARPIPRPMVEVPYHEYDSKVENGHPSVSIRVRPMLKVIKEQGAEVMEAADMTR